MRKYEMTANTKMYFGRKLYQIRALVNFEDIKAGDLGGYIEKEENLSHNGYAWVFNNAYVFGNALVYGNARVFDNVLIYGNAEVYGNARIYGNAFVFDNAQIYNNALVHGGAWIFNNALVYGDAEVFDSAYVCDNAEVYGDARVYGNAKVCCNALVLSDADYICFKGFGSENRNTTMFRTKNGDVFVRCGCFAGDLKEFLKKVKETHGSSIYAKEYLACAEVAKIHFGIND